MTEHIEGVRRYLDLSTAHIDKQTAEELDYDALGVTVHHFTYGWLVRVPAELSAELPASLRDVLAYARARDCDLVNLDRDAEQLDGLPVYDW